MPQKEPSICQRRSCGGSFTKTSVFIYYFLLPRLETGLDWPITPIVAEDNIKLLILLWCYRLMRACACYRSSHRTPRPVQGLCSSANSLGKLNLKESQTLHKKQETEPQPGYKRFTVYKNKLQQQADKPQPKNKGLSSVIAHGNHRPWGRLTGKPAHRAGTDHPLTTPC